MLKADNSTLKAVLLTSTAMLLGLTFQAQAQSHKEICVKWVFDGKTYSENRCKHLAELSDPPKRCGCQKWVRTQVNQKDDLEVSWELLRRAKNALTSPIDTAKTAKNRVGEWINDKLDDTMNELSN